MRINKERQSKHLFILGTQFVIFPGLNHIGADFYRGGGGQKIICARVHHEREVQSPLHRGSSARLTILEALGF